jgi:hypothetical protein
MPAPACKPPRDVTSPRMPPPQARATRMPMCSVRQTRLFQTWTPDQATQQRILVTNPARLYGFTG